MGGMATGYTVNFVEDVTRPLPQNGRDTDRIYSSSSRCDPYDHSNNIGAVDRAVAASSCCCCCCSLFACALVLTIAMSAAVKFSKSKILLDVGGVDCSLVRGGSR